MPMLIYRIARDCGAVVSKMWWDKINLNLLRRSITASM